LIAIFVYQQVGETNQNWELRGSGEEEVRQQIIRCCD